MNSMRLFRRARGEAEPARPIAYREPQLDPGCTLGAHRRLLDAHTLWHQTADAYDDADAFRANLNAAIQALRSVTLVLQTEQAQISNFDTWYAPWQDALKADSVCAWLNEARVEVFHRADLDVNSRARVSLVIDPHGERQLVEFDLPADATLGEVTAQARPIVVAFGLERGFALVERRWLANNLPDVELLDALTHCYGLLDRAVADAHAHLAVNPHTVSAEALECMAHGVDARAHRIDVVSGRSMEFKSVEVVLTDELREATAKRYGPRPSTAARTPRELAEQLVDFSKRVLTKDGRHHPELFLWRRTGELVTSGLVFADATDKIAQWERVAKEVERLDAVALIFIAEAWRRDVKNESARGEGLVVTLASEDGAVVTWTTPFKRRLGKIRLAETTTTTETTAFFLEPVLKAWRQRRAAQPAPPAQSTEDRRLGSVGRGPPGKRGLER